MRGSEIGRRQRHSFSELSEIMEIPNLMELQKNSYDEFLQMDVLPEERKKTAFSCLLSISHL